MRLPTLSLFLVLFVVPLRLASADVLYVDGTLTSGDDNGSSWTNAFSSLQDALAVATPGDEIWVAEGLYRPDQGLAQIVGERESTFQLRSGVTMLGGFPTGGGDGSVEARDPDPTTNNTVLTGDLLLDDKTGGNSAENAYHVVTGSECDSSAVLTGFLITGGDAVYFRAEENEGGGLFIASGSPTLERCHFAGNRARSGGAVATVSRSSPLFSNCSFTDNDASDDGGAVVSLLSTPVFRTCVFDANSADGDGGALACYATSSFEIINCRLSANTADGFGGAVHISQSSPRLTNCLITGNLADYCGGGCSITGRADPEFTNCTFTGNQARVDGGAIDARSPWTLRNSIIWNNQTADSFTSISASIHGTDGRCSHSLIANSGGSSAWNDLAGTDLGANIDADPQFMEALEPSKAPSVNGQFNLRSTSPAIDSGESTVNLESLDIAGTSRQFGSNIDRGAYEFDPSSFIIAHDAPTEESILANPQLSYLSLPDFPSLYNLTIDGVTLISESNPGLLDVTIHPNQSVEIRPTTASEGSTTLVFELVSGDAITNYPLDIHLLRPVLHVDSASSGDNDGTSWQDAFQNLQDALSSANGTTTPPAQEVWVAAGSYHPDQGSTVMEGDILASFALRSGVALLGGFLGDESEEEERSARENQTILSGDIGIPGDPADNSSHVVFGQNIERSAILDGFTITEGNANQRGSSDLDGIRNKVGGGLLLLAGSPTVRQCSFVNNRASSDGGAAYHHTDSEPLYLNCEFRSNSAGYGGAIYNRYSHPSFINCLFYDNQANQSYSLGGAMANSYSPVTLINCTLAGNFATFSNGAIYSRITPYTLENCIVWGNESRGGPTNPGLLNATHSLLEGYNSGETNLDGANPANSPLFTNLAMGDLRLLAGSPAINAGDNLSNFLPEDLSGAPRIQEETIDLGPYEGGVSPSFILLFPALDPENDENGNGRSNFTDYAMGAHPSGQDDSSASLVISDDILTASVRSNAGDVVTELLYSADLSENSWRPAQEGVDYNFQDPIISGQKTYFRLQTIRDPAIAPARFYRVRYFSR